MQPQVCACNQTKCLLYLSAAIKARGILGSKQHESRVGLDDLLRLGHKELPVVIEESVEGLQDVSGGQVQLVQDDPVAFPHGVDENAWKGPMSNQCCDGGYAGAPQRVGAFREGEYIVCICICINSMYVMPDFECFKD